MENRSWKREGIGKGEGREGVDRGIHEIWKPRQGIRDLKQKGVDWNTI